MAPWLGLGMLGFAIVGSRLEVDQRLALAGPNTAQRLPAELPPDVAEAVRSGRAEIRTMTREEYDAWAHQTEGALDGWPTLAATDETLLTRVIAETQGIDQATLAADARNSGRLGE